MVFHSKEEKWDAKPKDFVCIPRIGESVYSPSGNNFSITEIEHIPQGMWFKVVKR